MNHCHSEQSCVLKSAEDTFEKIEQQTQALSRSQVLKSCSCDLGSDKSNSEAWTANSMTV
jgi:hypothetical protein